MKYVTMFERGGEDLKDFKTALMRAKESIEMLCEISDEMEMQYSRRDSQGGDYPQKSEQEWERMKMRYRPR